MFEGECVVPWLRECGLSGASGVMNALKLISDSPQKPQSYRSRLRFDLQPLINNSSDQVDAFTDIKG